MGSACRARGEPYSGRIFLREVATQLTSGRTGGVGDGVGGGRETVTMTSSQDAVSSSPQLSSSESGGVECQGRAKEAEVEG